MNKKGSRWSALSILNILMSEEDYLTTKEIMDRVGCDRKTVSNAICSLELNGFGIDVVHGKKGKPNKYKFTKVYGFYN